MIKDAEFSNFTEHKNQKKIVLIWFFFVESECEQYSAHIVSPELVLTSAIFRTKYTMLIDRLTTESPICMCEFFIDRTSKSKNPLGGLIYVHCEAANLATCAGMHGNR